MHVYADGKELSSDEPGPVTTFSGGEAMLWFDSLPATLRIVVSGGHAGGEPVRGSLRTKVRGVTNGEIVHVNPVTTVSALLAHPEDGRSIRHVRNLTERTLGIRPSLDDHDLYVTDQWFEGDRFRRWTMEQGSVGAGARDLVQLIERPGFDRRPFLQGDEGGPEARVAASAGASAANVGNRLRALDCETLTGTGKEVIGGLVDALVAGIGLAQTLTGPAGFGLGAAGALFKGFVSLVDPCADRQAGEDPVHGALRALAAQVTQLQKQVSEIKDQIDQEFFQGQLAGASAKVRAIENTQAEFLSMLNWARDRDKAQVKLESCQKHGDGCDRGAVDAARTSLVQREIFFLIGAEELAGPKDKAADYLNDALMGEKTAGSRAGLISGVRLGHGDPRRLGTCDGGLTPAAGLACWRDHEHAGGREVFPGNYGVREPGREAWYPFLLETSHGKFRPIRGLADPHP